MRLLYHSEEERKTDCGRHGGTLQGSGQHDLIRLVCAGKRVSVREEALACLESNPPILVAGDVMLGEAGLGGCGSVIGNLSSLGAIVSSLCFVGADGEGATVRKQLGEKCRNVHEVPTLRKTITQTKIIAEGDQLARVDDADSFAMTPDEQRAAMRALEGVNFGELTATVISDHGKGFCSPLLCGTIIERSASAGIPTFVKPGKGSWDKYRSATVVCANLHELSLACGREIPDVDSSIEQAGREILKRHAIEALAVTRGQKGVSIVRSGEAIHTGTIAYAEGGFAAAADAVISVAARLAGSGLQIDAALAIAGEAAGTSEPTPDPPVVTPTEVIEAISRVHLGEDGQGTTWSYAEAGRIAAHLKQRSKKVVFTNGCFDVLHPGHLSLLRRARKLGDFLIVGLNSDASVRRLKGPTRPVNDEMTRSVMLAGLRCVDLVAVFTEDTPTELLRAVRPDILVKGSEYSLEEVPGREFAAATVLLSMVPGFSSTASIKNIKAS